MTEYAHVIGDDHHDHRAHRAKVYECVDYHGDHATQRMRLPLVAMGQRVRFRPDVSQSLSRVDGIVAWIAPVPMTTGEYLVSVQYDPCIMHRGERIHFVDAFDTELDVING